MKKQATRKKPIPVMVISKQFMVDAVLRIQAASKVILVAHSAHEWRTCRTAMNQQIALLFQIGDDAIENTFRAKAGAAAKEKAGAK